MTRMLVRSSRLFAPARVCAVWWMRELREAFAPLLARIDEEQRHSMLRLYPGKTELVIGKHGAHGAMPISMDSDFEQLTSLQRDELCRMTEGTELCIGLAQGAAHILRIRLPASMPLTTESVRYRLLQDSPIDVEVLLFDWRASAPSAGKQGTTVIEVAICRKDLVERVRASAITANLPVSSIGFGLSDADRLDFVFWERPDFDARRLLAAHRNKTLVAMLAAIPLLITGGFGLYSHIARRALVEEVRSLSEQNREGEAIMRRHASLVAIRAEIASALAAPPASRILDELAGIVPRDVWLTELRIDGTRLNIVGHSANPAGTAKGISALPILSDVRLDSASSQASDSDGAKFEISARISGTP